MSDIGNFLLDFFLKIVVYGIPLLFAITLHECGHGYAAKWCGDRTAEFLGRLSLNPLRHIDPVGTVLLPLTTVILGTMSGLGPVVFGWAKPVPVNTRQLNNPRADMFWVALAGPAANLVMALLWALVLALSYGQQPLLATMAFAGVGINASLMVLNLLPILPLDGGRMVASVLPYNALRLYERHEPYGLWITLLLVVTGLLNVILLPSVQAVRSLVLSLVGL